MVIYVKWILWDQIIFKFLLFLQDGQDNESDNIDENVKITDGEEDEQ